MDLQMRISFIGVPRYLRDAGLDSLSSQIHLIQAGGGETGVIYPLSLHSPTLRQRREGKKKNRILVLRSMPTQTSRSQSVFDHSVRSNAC